MKNPAVYIMTNKRDGILYTGVTSNLVKRCYEHKNDMGNGFTSKYRCKLLVYYEMAGNMYAAISIEKQIRGGSRASKLKLIEEMNPNWLDLYYDICG